MKLKLFCSHCGLKMDSNIYGKQALEVIEKYDTLIHGIPYTFRCTCKSDMHIQGTMIKYYTPQRDDLNRIAEI